MVHCCVILIAYFLEETGLPVIVAEDPLTCVARGGGKAMELMDRKGFDLFTTE